MSIVERNVYCASYSLPYKGNESLVNAMHKAKNLYNATLWYYRQALDEHQKAKEEGRDPLTEYPDYYKMERKFRDERQINYFDLPQKVSQWVLKDVQSDWRAFVKLIIWKKSLPDSDPRKQQDISPPHYKYKDGQARLRYTKQAFSLKAVPGKIVPSGTDTALDIPKFVNPYRITQLVIEPEGDRHMRITFIYKVDLQDMLVDNGKVAGADLGVNNLVTIGTNVGRGIIVDGKPLKSVNQWYNKRMAELRSLNDILYEKENKRKVETQRHRKTAKMERLSRNRRNWIRNYLHWASRRIIDFIASAGITTQCRLEARVRHEQGEYAELRPDPACKAHRHALVQGQTTRHRMPHYRGIVHIQVFLPRPRGDVSPRQVRRQAYQARTVRLRCRKENQRGLECRVEHDQKSNS